VKCVGAGREGLWLSLSLQHFQNSFCFCTFYLQRLLIVC